MKVSHHRIFDGVAVVLFLLFFSFTIVLNFSCQNDDATGPGVGCGSGHATWDSKAEICRDDADGHPLDRSCCGR